MQTQPGPLHPYNIHLKPANGVLYQRARNLVDVCFQVANRKLKLGPEFQSVLQVPTYTVHQVKNVTLSAQARGLTVAFPSCMEGPAAPAYPVRCDSHEANFWMIIEHSGIFSASMWSRKRVPTLVILSRTGQESHSVTVGFHTSACPTS